MWRALTSLVKHIDRWNISYKLFLYITLSLLFPFMLLRFCFIVFRHRKTLKNSIVFADFYNASFGHQIQAYEGFSRLFSPYRVTLFSFDQPRMNPYLHLCYPNIDTILIKSWHLKFVRFEYRLMHKLLLFISLFTDTFNVTDARNILYKSLSLLDTATTDPKPMLCNRLDHTGYAYKLSLNRGPNPSLPSDLKTLCEQALTTLHPTFFNKPFITLFLRSKGEGKAYSDSARNPGDQSHYIDAVNACIKQGYHVVGWAGTDDAVFQGIDGYFSIRDCTAPSKLMNLYVLMHSCLLITQHSGPYILSNACRVPVVMCDAFPYYLGTYIENDIVLHKRPFSLSTGKTLGFYEWYTEHPNLVASVDLPKEGYDVLPNTALEITQTIQEALNQLSPNYTPSSRLLELKNAFRNTVPQPDTVLRYERNTPPQFILEEMADKLLPS